MSLVSINLLRSLAIFLMFSTHSIRLLPKNIWEQQYIFSFLMKIEPFTSALFLFLVGFSLALSYNKDLLINNNELKWRIKQIRRSVFLYITGVVLFIIQFGLQIPDLFVSPNVLSAIALAIFMNIILINRPILTSILMVLFVLIELGLDSAHISISGINQGPGGALILIAFSFLGMLCAKNWKIEKDIWILSFLMFLISLYPTWIVSYKSQYSASKFIIEFPAKNVSFWTHTAFAFLGIGPIFVLFSHFIFKDKITSKFITMLSSPGKNSLELYLIHLSIISVLFVSDVVKTTFQCGGIIVGLIFFSYIYSFIKSAILKKKKAWNSGFFYFIY